MKTNIALRRRARLPPLLFCSAPAETRLPVTAVSRQRAVVVHRRVKQAVSNPRKTAADDNKRLTDEEWYRTRSDDWMGRSSRRGGATPGARGKNRKTEKTDWCAICGQIRVWKAGFTSNEPGTGKIFHSYLMTRPGWTVCTWARRKMFLCFMFLLVSLFSRSLTFPMCSDLFWGNQRKCCVAIWTD